MSGVSQKVLTQTLRAMERDGVVEAHLRPARRQAEDDSGHITAATPPSSPPA